MSKNLYKTKVSKLVKEAKQKGVVKKYSEFCKTDEGQKNTLSEEELKYYTSKDKGENN